MEPRILLEEEIPQAADVARGVFDCCLRKTVPQLELVSHFESYANADNLRQLVSEERLTLWGIFMDGQLCAMSGMQSEGHITMLYVLPFYQRHGLGKLLLRTMRKYAGEQYKITRVTVNAMPVWTSAFFEKAGFHRMGTPQYGAVPFLSLEAKSIVEISYPKKPIREKTLLGIVFGFLGAVFLIAILFMGYYIFTH